MTVETSTDQLWCDNFDADLLKVVPGVPELLEETADVKLWTHCASPTNGRINSPAAWHSDFGLAAFFTTDEDVSPVPAHFWPQDQALVGCTFLEALRDEWIHTCAIVVNRTLIWTPPYRDFETLMWDVRNWGAPLEAHCHAIVQARVRAGLVGASLRLRGVLAAQGVDRG